MAEPTTTRAHGMPSFDLTERPWIGVLGLDGGQHELSLREVFARAGELRRITAELPTVEFALVRLLLAVAHDALDGPEDAEGWGELWAAAQAEEDCFAPVGEYLDRHRERFDLLHPGTPFFQTPGLRTAKDEVFSLNRIVADVPNGEPFLSARMPTVDRLTFAEAARWVVHAHAYDTSGIKSGAVGDDRMKNGKVYPLGTGWAGGLGGVFVEGRDLRETLLLNLVAADTPEVRIDEDDAPAWRRLPSGPGGAERVPTGVRDLYTWQSRRVRLHFDADGVHGVVLGYGDPLRARNRHGREPMTAWRRSEPQEKKLREKPVYLPRDHDPARAAWRGIGSLVAGRAAPPQGAEPPSRLRPGILEWVARLVTDGDLTPDHPIRARIVGAAYGTQQSVIDEIVDDHLGMKVVLLHKRHRSYADAAVHAAEDAETAVRALGDLATDLARAAGSEGDSSRSAARSAGFDALEGRYRAWLLELADAADPAGARLAWQQEAHRALLRLGGALVANAGDAAWEGRQVTDKKAAYWLDASLAERWFRIRLFKLLGDPYGADSSPASDDPQAARTPDAPHTDRPTTDPTKVDA
ncbi:type I-E CRISPR-associated protein Cse1/CasA [Streptomyces sp. NPDC005805]|uniref:type I-E CRISPR-associated protein Cse1/CasA n=1 Tax=Streptomyces sp. NPDC005805 TaxID=3157068 RepID=UPI0033DF8E84